MHGKFADSVEPRPRAHQDFMGAQNYALHFVLTASGVLESWNVPDASGQAPATVNIAIAV
jgi:hypothetical protein